MEQCYPLSSREFALSCSSGFFRNPPLQQRRLVSLDRWDYQIRQAIVDNIVKRPVKGIAELDEAKSTIASERYQGYLTAGVERWREYKEQLEPLGKTPLLFIMMNTTEEAEDVGDWLRHKYPSEFGGDKKVLVIHTDKTGEITKRILTPLANLHVKSISLTVQPKPLLACLCFAKVGMCKM